MFNNDLLSDVKFVVRGTNGEKESKRRKQVIPAHKFVLSIRSSVFFTVNWQRLETLLNCLTVNTTVCWSCFVTCTAI